MNDEFNQLIGKMLSSLEHNTKLTEKIAGDIGDVKEDVAAITGKIEAHDKYLANLDTRIVKGQEKHEELHTRLVKVETKGQSSTDVFKWVGGIIATVIGGVLLSFFLANK
jgi:chromosome segregation ATPase